MEELDSVGGPISLALGPQGGVMQAVSRLDDLPELQSSSSSLTSPKQKPDSLLSSYMTEDGGNNENGCMTGTEISSSNAILGYRRHSAPIIIGGSELIRRKTEEGPESGGKVKVIIPVTGGMLSVDKRAMPRRCSLPLPSLSQRQLDMVRLTGTAEINRSLGSCSTTSSGSERILAVEAT